MEKDLVKAIHTYHRASSRHTLVLEADMTHEQKCKVFGYAERVRKLTNEIRHFIDKRIKQLYRTKRYRKLLQLYRTYREKHDEKNRKMIQAQIVEMQEQYGINFEICRMESLRLQHKYGIHSHVTRSALEAVWTGVEIILYGNGRHLNYSRRGELPAIVSRDRCRGIVIRQKDGKLEFKIEDMIFGAIIKKNDRFAKDEIERILEYLSDAKNIDKSAAMLYREKGIVIETFRPVYASLVCRTIRRRLRVFVHILVEAKPVQKYDSAGRIRHTLGKGVVGTDIGTQTAAYYSDTDAGLLNLGERGRTVQKVERKISSILSSMGRSRRACNPENYNSDGTCKKKPEKWNLSKRYLKLREDLRIIERKASINRHLAINELVNHLRSLGDVIITEEKNAGKLMRRAKKTTVNEKTGKSNKKKRYGNSIEMRCPGYYQERLQQKFEATGGYYKEVGNKYRASQYDVSADEYIEKSLSDRYYLLSDGTRVQRDLYSSYLLYCARDDGSSIDIDRCKAGFRDYCMRQERLVADMREHKRKVCNSGIKIS